MMQNKVWLEVEDVWKIQQWRWWAIRDEYGRQCYNLNIVLKSRNNDVCMDYNFSNCRIGTFGNLEN